LLTTLHGSELRKREVHDLRASATAREIPVALLTGGADRPYAFGLATALMSRGTVLDVIANDELDGPEFHDKTDVKFFNLRASQRPDVSFPRKVFRVSAYYAKLIRYAATAKPKIFHILWNNKFETLDRTLLMLYYRFLGKKIVLTVHNVNAPQSLYVGNPISACRPCFRPYGKDED
jgi:hypothetical protein